MAKYNKETNLMEEYSQNVLNMDEVISRSKVASSFNKSCAEIQNAQIIELQKVSNIVKTDNDNLRELNRKCEKSNLRGEYKLQMALESNKALIMNMVQVSDSFRTLHATIEELEENKTTIEKRNNEIGGLWKKLNDIQRVEIPEAQHKIFVLRDNILNVQCSIKSNLEEKEALESEKNAMGINITDLDEKVVKQENILVNLQQEFILETDQNSKRAIKRDELQCCIQEKSSHFTEMKQRLDNSYGDKLAETKMHLEKELDDENLKNTNIGERILGDRADEEFQLIKLNEQWDETDKKLHLQIEHSKNQRDELRKSNELKNNERIEEQKLIMSKTQRIETLEKRKMEFMLLIKQKEQEYNQLDVNHQTEEMKIENVANLEARNIKDKIQALMLKNKDLKQKLAQSQMNVSQMQTKKDPPPFTPQNSSISQNSSTSQNPATLQNRSSKRKLISDRLVTKSKPTLKIDETDGESFFSNISFGSELNQTITRFKLPPNFPKSYRRDRTIKSAGIPKPMIAEYLSSSDDSL